MATIHQLIQQGNIEAVKEIIASQPEAIHSKDEKGFPALVFAVYFNQPEITKLLIEKGADLEARDVLGNTALMGAAFKGNKAMVEILIASGADVNAVNNNQMTAADYATKYGHEEILKLLK